MWIHTDINVCPRCHQPHENLEFRDMRGSPVIQEYTYLGKCPAYAEPIFMKIGDWLRPNETTRFA